MHATAPFFIVADLATAVRSHEEQLGFDVRDQAPPEDPFFAMVGRGATILTPIAPRDDGLRGFEVRDADGYVLFFGRPDR